MQQQPDFDTTPLWETLRDWLALADSAVFDRFAEFAPQALTGGSGDTRYLYIPGKRADRVVLVAHVDTTWGSSGVPAELIVYDEGILRSGKPGCGIGADDRAGCAALWSLRDLGHSLLLLAGEEQGALGATELMHNPALVTELNQTHQFMVEFDRRNACEFKCYSVGTPEFRAYVHGLTRFTEPDRRSHTDICTLCSDICGVNLSMGFDHEHFASEALNVAVWQRNVALARAWLANPDLPRFPLR
jgi:hypothetical protein